MGHSCLHESAQYISVMCSMPGRLEANVTWLQVILNSSGRGVCRAFSPSSPIPWMVVDGGMKSTAMIYFRASTRYMTKQAKPSGTDGHGQRWTTCLTPHFSVGHLLTVMDSEYASQAPFVKGIHRSWYCPCYCPGFCSTQKDRQDIYRIKAELGRHGYTGAPDVAIQLCHAIPRDHNCHCINQTTEVGNWLNDVYSIASHLNMLRNWRVDCCPDFCLASIDCQAKRTGFFLHNLQRQDKNLEHLSKQSYIICMVQNVDRITANTCSCQTSVKSTLNNPIRRGRNGDGAMVRPCLTLLRISNRIP